MKTGAVYCFASVMLFLTGCSTIVVSNRIDNAQAIAKTASFQPFSVNTDLFRIAGFRKVRNSLAPVSVYIEGDGFAWIDRYTVSSNPTPRNPLALKLASLDAADNVIYLARPCQFVDLEKEVNCRKEFWTRLRYSKEVLSSYHQVLGTLAEENGSRGFHLIGFSGGGAIATLIASRRSDIISLRTVAGNLDHGALNKARGVSPLTGSLNPISVAQKLKTLPQIHFSGGKDTVIPSWVSQKFAQTANNPACVQTEIVPNATHLRGWVSAWKQLNSRIPQC